MPLRRADRLFDILRGSVRGVASGYRRFARRRIGSHGADGLSRYRHAADAAHPIESVPGIGYVLRRGFELPPLMFTEDEAEAIAVGVRMLARTGDPGLQKAADSVLSKVTLVVPDLLHEYFARRRSISRRAAPRCRRGATCRP